MNDKNSTKPTTDSGLFIGLMSGTSLDGIDVVVARFAPELKIEFAHTYDLPPSLVKNLLALSQTEAHIHLDDVGRLDSELGECFAGVVSQCLQDADITADAITAIGSHGQTLRHAPQGPHAFTMQLGNAHIIAEQCGIDTVADFRRRDVAAGGQGAPLVPAFHASVFSGADEARAVLNIGGIANLTLLPRDGQVRGFDTGPGNGLMDAWCRLHSNINYDANGELAASGHVNAELLQHCLSDDWFKLPPPKSTGRDQFNLAWLQSKMQGMTISAADVQATLTALTAYTIADALQTEMPGCQRVLVCGGGSHNPVLMEQLRRRLAPILVVTTEEHGLHPDYVEAAAFAWLAKEFLAKRPGNLPAVTGAKDLRVLGVLYPK
ncbi:MAG: anhydro-N-acetylmuramic acid kinase [Arenimonas sp.]